MLLVGGKYMKQNNYIRLSLELHLFFDCIMKEHSFFLETAFMEKNKNYKRIANNFKNNFSNILSQIVNLDNNNVSEVFLKANEIITANTLESEVKTSDLSGVEIDTNITKRQKKLKSGRANINQELINSISSINRKTLPLIQNLIDFKNDILNNIFLVKCIQPIILY